MTRDFPLRTHLLLAICSRTSFVCSSGTDNVYVSAWHSRLTPGFIYQISQIYQIVLRYQILVISFASFPSPSQRNLMDYVDDGSPVSAKALHPTPSKFSISKDKVQQAA